MHDYTVIDRKIFERGYYLKISLLFTDSSELHLKEYIDEYERNYSYRWQTSSGELIVRWDNAPHHRDINTFPHHKHVNNRVVPSNEIEVKQIFNSITKIIYSG